MKKLILILKIIFISLGNTSDNIKIINVCEWYHEEIIGWHQTSLLFRKRHIEVSDKSKYLDNKKKTIERNLLKQQKLLQAIDNAEKKLITLSKIYHYLDCSRFEKKF